MRQITAKCSADVIRWIIENEHHRGWWTEPANGREFFCLEGKNARLRIPSKIHRPGLMTGADFAATHRMYEPTPEGMSALTNSDAKPE